MVTNQSDANVRPAVDAEIAAIVDYVRTYQPSDSAIDAAVVCLTDSVACALMALQYPACTRHLGAGGTGTLPAGAAMDNGARVFGTAHQLDPIKATFDNGALIRWLDFNDTWLAAEWGHPSDNAAAVVTVADYLSRNNIRTLTVRDVLVGMVKAHEIQGVLALENSLNRVGLDHVALVKIASTAVASHLLGLDEEQMLAAVSHAFADGQSLRTYRHAPNAGSRKSWAAGDAAARAVRLATLAQVGEASIPTAISAKTWGFADALFGGKPLVRSREYGSYVMENILYKVSYPAEFHAQTAVECAIALHPQIAQHGADAVARMVIETQESAVRIISKTGPLYNPADRDHCLQYMVAIGLLFGDLTAAHYEDATANDARIDALREKMEVSENPQFSRDYLDPDMRAIGNAVQVFFANGSSSERVEVAYPLGHRRRRDEARPHLQNKFTQAVAGVFADTAQQEGIIHMFADTAALCAMRVCDFTDRLVPN